jgi:hypothetical protein
MFTQRGILGIFQLMENKLYFQKAINSGKVKIEHQQMINLKQEKIVKSRNKRPSKTYYLNFGEQKI